MDSQKQLEIVWVSQPLTSLSLISTLPWNSEITKHQNDTNKISDMNFNRSPSVAVRFGYKKYSGHANIMI